MTEEEFSKIKEYKIISPEQCEVKDTYAFFNIEPYPARTDRCGGLRNKFDKKRIAIQCRNCNFFEE